MKNIILAVLFASSGLMAVDGAKIYKQRCAKCHGEKAIKSPKNHVPALAGRDVTKLALTIRAYRDQDTDVGSYTMHKSSQLMKDATGSLSREQIVALAKYISALK
jgi:cytochrome c553